MWQRPLVECSKACARYTSQNEPKETKQFIFVTLYVALAEKVKTWSCLQTKLWSKTLVIDFCLSEN